jgi:hypothetical protein
MLQHEKRLNSVEMSLFELFLFPLIFAEKVADDRRLSLFSEVSKFTDLI